MKIEINKFKKIDSALVNLTSLNVFVGANNSGKSSFIQGIQFAVSASQTLELEKCAWTKAGVRTLSLDSSEFLYTPTKNVESLYHGKKLTGSRERKDRSEIKFSFKVDSDSANVTISKGKNGGFTTSLEGKELGETMGDMRNPFCVYVPGLAGIPTEEKYEVPIAVRKSATRGDSNNYLRNILLTISKDIVKWDSFLSSVTSIYENVKISVIFDEDKSEYILVNVKINEVDVPLDMVGTGLLQVIQIFAYIEYFKPRLILLDEPDAHIHPTKQKRLANELAGKTRLNPDLRIIFSTHSRYILETLEDKANVVHFKEGRAYPHVKGSSILIDIGAIDSESLFGKKNIKYIIATEDKVDFIDEKKKFLEKFLIANSLAEDEFVLHSYEGCTKVHFAKILQSFVVKHIPHVRVILHIDRDQKIDSDSEFVKLRADCKREGIALFVTKFQEIESYFCQPCHISLTCDLPYIDVKNEYDIWLNELDNKTRMKLKNFVLNDRNQLIQNDKGRTDASALDALIDEWMSGYREIFTPGKELLGKVKNFLQNKKIDTNKVLNISEGLVCKDFTDVMKKLNEIKVPS